MFIVHHSKNDFLQNVSMESQVLSLARHLTVGEGDFVKEIALKL